MQPLFNIALSLVLDLFTIAFVFVYNAKLSVPSAYSRVGKLFKQ